MSTVIRNSVSKKNKYYIGKHRYLELKHFCLQYPEWKKEVAEFDGLKGRGFDYIRGTDIPDPTGNAAVRIVQIKEKIKMVENAATLSDPTISKFLLKGVTEGYAFPYLKAVMEIPCERDMYYDRYRRFFYILSHHKQLLE